MKTLTRGQMRFRHLKTVSETFFPQHTPTNPDRQIIQEELSCTSTVLGKGEVWADPTYTKEKVIKPGGSQCKRCEMDFGGGQTAGSKNCPITPITGMMTVYFILMYPSSLGCGMG